jgi:sigma-B regulation protein RsbU (phosphoserine phosphatase)
VIQFGPALLGGLYWRRGNKAGAITGIFLGSVLWFYTLMVPSLVKSGWWQSNILEKGPFGLQFLKPTELFGLTGFDIWSNSLFWSMFFNIGGYLVLSIILSQDENEKEQVKKFVDVFTPPADEPPWEAKRLSKPVTIIQFVNLMAKFIGEGPAHAAIADYLGSREIDEQGGVSEFELPQLKRFIEKTLAGSLGGAAAGAIVESYLSDIGSKMESVYNIFSTVRTELSESREALSVRLRASEIMNRTLDLQIIMYDLLELIRIEFKLDLAVIRIVDDSGGLVTRSLSGTAIPSITERRIIPDINTYIGDAFLSNRPRFLNDTRNNPKPESREILDQEVILSFAHIPIAREGESSAGVLSVFSRSIIGLFTQPFIDLLTSLSGQLAQAIKIDSEIKAREQERRQNEEILLENVRVTREMEIAKQIQLSLLPPSPPDLSGALLACSCIPATHVGGDYYDFFRHGNDTIDIVIADVSGHSVGAALIMAETRSVLRAQFHATNSTGDILALLNEELYEDLTNAELFITMFYVKFDMASRLLTYASAGHNRPLLFRPGSSSCTELDAEGLILGVKRNVLFEEKTEQLQEGDVLLMYTDGVTEAQNRAGELFGEGRLCAILSSICTEHPDAMIDRVLSAVTAFSAPEPQQDDLSLVIIKVT